MFNPKQPIKRGDIVRVVGDTHKRIVWEAGGNAFDPTHTAEEGGEYEVNSVQSPEGRVFLYPIGCAGGVPIKVCGTMDLELITPKA